MFIFIFIPFIASFMLELARVAPSVSVIFELISLLANIDECSVHEISEYL